MDPDPHSNCGSGSAFKLLIWIRLQEGKKLPTKIEKSTVVSWFEVLDVLF
jgi:hypothetical protein